MQSTKDAVLALLAQAQELIEQGDWACDGIGGTDEQLGGVADEMAGMVADAIEKVVYYMD